MTDNFIKISFLLDKLNRKIEKLKLEDYSLWQKKMDALQKIVWYSFPIVYPRWDEWSRELVKAKKARRARKLRISKYLKSMFMAYDAEKLYFLTITFDNDAFKAKSSTRYQNVSRYLNAISYDYMANLDYGSKNKREHYHAVVASDKDLFSLSIPHAFIHYKRIVSRNPKRIAKYLSKLTNHAQKLTCGKPFHKRGMVDVDSLPF